jgi:hypothetical protein
MKKRVRLLFSLPILLCASSAAMAAASDQEADRLTKLFQSYLTAEPGVVTVKTDGEGYRVKLDFAPLAKKASDAGATFSITPFELALADKGGGKWDVSQDSPITYSLKVDNSVAADIKAESYTWNGIFDEKLNTFETASGEIKNMTVAETIDDPAQGKMAVNATIKSAKIQQSATSNANGGADMKLSYVMDSLSETIVTSGNPEKGMPPFNVTLNAESVTYDATGQGFKVKSIFDLLSFLISHQSKDLIVKDQAALKTMLADAIPGFENLNGTVKFDKVTATTPIGPVGFDNISVMVDANGIVKDGKLRESVSFAGLSVPPAVIPPWATSLVPKNMTIDFTAGGFNLAEPAKLILENVDFSKEPPMASELDSKLTELFMPNGTATVALNPTSLSNDIYNISAEGSVVAGTAVVPSGKGTIKAKGLDDILKVIQSAPPEMGLQSGTALIIAAKGMGKAESDGTFTWNIESTGDGKVLINGIDPTKLK